MTVQVTGDDPESCDECGARWCVLRPVRLDNGDTELVCGDCFLALDEERVDAHDWRQGPPPRRTGVEEFNPVGPAFGLIDPDAPRERYVHAGNAVDLEVWR